MAADFEALLMPVLDRAFGMAMSLTRSRTDAEDLVQEASLLAFRAFHTFEPGSNFKAWYFKILTNAFYTSRRRASRRPVETDIDGATSLYLYGKCAEAGLHEGTEDPAGRLLGKLDAEQIMAAIDSLPEEFRVVCTLYFVEDLPYQEIAESVGCPVGTVRSRLHRGRRVLQKILWKMAVEQGIVRDLTAAGAAT